MMRLFRPSLMSLVSVAVCFLFSAGCHGMDQSELTQQFLQKPMDQRRELILDYPIKQQINLYLAAMQKHPPDLALANSLASEGSKIVPLLKKRLREEKEDWAKLQLIDVFSRMQRFGYYSVATDQKTLELLENQVTLMSDRQWKGIASRMVKRIKKHKSEGIRDRPRLYGMFASKYACVTMPCPAAPE